jgi:hypothetical protein
VLRLPDGETHWFLSKTVEIYTGDGWVEQEEILDASRLQFKGELPRYYLGRACGFLTKTPSKRARVMMDLMTYQGREVTNGGV